MFKIISMSQVIQKIAIIGNGGGGKTTLSRLLGARFELPVTHVDSIQYLPGLQVRDRDETSSLLYAIASQPRWIIEGFGTLEVMHKRFEQADKVIFVDFPLWRHYWWCLKRQVITIWKPRSELPENCREATIAQTVKLFKILWRVHTEIRPQLLKIFSDPAIDGKLLRIRSLREWTSFANAQTKFDLAYESSG